MIFSGRLCWSAETQVEAATAPDFKDVYDSVRAHLPGVGEAELNRAAVQGLISALGGKVSLLTNGESPKAAGDALPVSRSTLMEGGIAYLRVETVTDGLAKAVEGAYTRLAASNRLKGVILDLRYCDGHDYAAAAATVDLFLKSDRPLLNWGEGLARSKVKSNAIAVPVAVLVNPRTAGAAEALAAAMREASAGLILGGRTAGQAAMVQEFPLKNGDRLRIATTAVQLGDGSTISTQGIRPDILVNVSPEDELGYYANAYKGADQSDVAGVGASITNRTTGTNAPRRPRLNEAELVRERREGLSEADLSGIRDREPEKPLVADPTLARALDLLKGLAVVRATRS